MRINRKGVWSRNKAQRLVSYLNIHALETSNDNMLPSRCFWLILVADAFLETRERIARAKAILTPNNAGMFRGRAGWQGRNKGHRQVLSELSSNTTTDDEGDTETGKREGPPRGSPFQNGANGAKTISPFAPKRRMTFGGIRSDKRGEIYKAQRRPSFLDSVGRRAVGAAETAAKAVRRLSFQGNTELVAVAVRLS